MTFRKRRIPDVLARNVSFTDLFGLPSCCCFSSCVLIMKAHLPQNIDRALLWPRHYIMCSRFLEKKDIPRSLADILRHSCLYFFSRNICCWPPGAWATPLSSLSLSRSLSSALDSLQSPLGSSGSFSIRNVCLWCWVLSVWAAPLLGNSGKDKRVNTVTAWTRQDSSCWSRTWWRFLLRGWGVNHLGARSFSSRMRDLDRLFGQQHFLFDPTFTVRTVSECFLLTRATRRLLESFLLSHRRACTTTPDQRGLTISKKTPKQNNDFDRLDRFRLTLLWVKTQQVSSLDCRI